MIRSTSSPVAGATPKGATDPRTAALAVRQMFTAIAPRYDLLNHLLSCNVDRLWWRRTAQAFTHILSRPGAQVLDLCCGTGDMAFALLAHSPTGSCRILGADFSHAMLQLAARKSRGTRLQWLEADALKLPLAAGTFDLVTSAFGFRNLASYDAGLRESARVLKPGGELGILDFAIPGGLLGRLYQIYFRRILPILGTLISGVSGPYSYLPASVEQFPPPHNMLDRMRRAGFTEVSCTPYSLGIACLYRGRRV